MSVAAGSAGRWLYVQEYAPPATVDRDKARARREEAISVLPEVTGLPVESIYWRTRRPQKGKSQYEAIAEVDERVVVEEGGTVRQSVVLTDARVAADVTRAIVDVGAVLTEAIFSWTGIGSYAVDAARNLDYPAIMGVTIVGGAAFLLTNLATDIAYAFADPRIRLN